MCFIHPFLVDENVMLRDESIVYPVTNCQHER